MLLFLEFLCNGITRRYSSCDLNRHVERVYTADEHPQRDELQILGMFLIDQPLDNLDISSTNVPELHSATRV